MTLFAHPAEKLIVALDGMKPSQAVQFTSQLSGLRWVKVGLELFVLGGPQVVIELRDRGLRVFLDLKLHDIPATMAGACRRAASIGADLITLHACAGSKALLAARLAAVQGAEEAGIPPPTLLGVTVLTSWEPKPYAKELSMSQPINERVEGLANMVASAGLGGCVCSPLEVANLRKLHSLPFELVTPGIRPKGSPLNDQERVMSPCDAIQAGASRLVVGRPITCAVDPVEAFSQCCRELERC